MSLDLSERIMSLRVAASTIYDRGVIMGAKPEQIVADVKPIQDMLKKLIGDAVEGNLAGLLMAITRMENSAKAHELDIKFLIQKVHNAEYHAKEMRAALAADMVAKGITSRSDGDFSVTLIESEGNHVLNIR